MWVPNLPVTLASTICATAGALCLYKDMRSGPPYDKKRRADDLTIIVTGATSGIGKETAWDMARRGAKVFMACRDMEKCEKVRRDIVVETQNKYVYCRPCDLASLESVAQFVKRYKSEEPRCDVLVNNAGVLEPPRGLTRDGFELQLGINHLGHFLLTNLLLDTLKESAPSRVIIVSADAHRRGKLNKADLNMTNNYDPSAAYAQSKLANMLFARELGRRTLEHKISVVAVEPGLTDTELTRHLAVMRSTSRFLLYPLFWPFMKSAKIGAQTVVHAALDEETAASAGDYYVNMQKAEPSETAQDFELAQWLWKVSEKWTRLEHYKEMLSKAAAA